MRSRKTIIELFSTFLQFEADRFVGWATDAKLRRSMKANLSNADESEASESFWAVYWHKSWKEAENKQLAQGHLSAYLQEVCYWSVYKLIPRLQGSQSKISDFFQIAIAAVPKILKACDPDASGSLKAYAASAFTSVVRDYARQNREADFSSNWGLLLRVSRKCLREALENSGLDAATIERYLLAWTCFESIFLPQKTPQMRHLSAPDSATWLKIASSYNKMRLAQLSQPGPECTPEILEKWLTDCTNKVRKYLHPSFTSLNTPKPGYEEGELQDELVDTQQESLLTELINQEELAARLEQRTQINHFLEEAIAQLDPTQQKLLQLYYRDGLTQQQIAKELEVQQYTVSRKLSKTRESLLLMLTRWSQETLHISVTSNVVKYMSTLLEEWLSVRS